MSVMTLFLPTHIKPYYLKIYKYFQLCKIVDSLNDLLTYKRVKSGNLKKNSF